jgi:hypothetical protein
MTLNWSEVINTRRIKKKHVTYFKMLSPNLSGWTKTPQKLDKDS